jgi:hypothetical protein
MYKISKRVIKTEGAKRACLLTLLTALLLSLWFIGGQVPFTYAAGVGGDAQLAQIIINNHDGSPASNAIVQIHIIPQQGLGQGQVAEPLAGVGKTDATGRVIASITPPALTNATLVSPKKFVNYEMMVVASDGTLEVDYNFTRYYGNEAPQAQMVTKISAMHLKARTAFTGTINPANGTVQMTNGQTLPMSHSASPQKGGGCISTSWNNTGRSWVNWTVVGELHSVPGFKATFIYGQTADSQISIGETFNAKQTWTGNGNGSITIGNSSGATITIVQQNKWGHQIQTLFTYAEQQFVCYPGGGTPTYRVVPTQWDGGVNYGADVSGSDNHRNSYGSPYYPGNQFTRSSNALYTYNAAINLGFVQLSAKSGASTNTQLNWNNIGSKTLYLYGNNSYPTSSTIIYSSQN